MKNPDPWICRNPPPDEIMQECFEAYHTYAQELNLRTQPDPASIPFMDGMSDALVWPDECPEDAPMELISALRFIWNHRTSLLLETIPQFEENWKIANKCFPSWVGFRPERTSPSPELQHAIEEGKQSLNKMFDEMHAEKERQEKERQEEDMNRSSMEEAQDPNTHATHPLEVMRADETPAANPQRLVRNRDRHRKMLTRNCRVSGWIHYGLIWD
jgi:hypothetical protein